jgi:hypothetical protein
MNLKQFSRTLAAGSGASYSLTQGEITSGIMASMAGHERKVFYGDHKMTQEVLERSVAAYVIDFVAEKGLMAERENVSIGGWWSNGCLYLDLSVRFDSLVDAAEFGIMNGQKAIYDIDNQREIELPQPQIAGTETQKRQYAKLAATKVVGNQ